MISQMNLRPRRGYEVVSTYQSMARTSNYRVTTVYYRLRYWLLIEQLYGYCTTGYMIQICGSVLTVEYLSEQSPMSTRRL